MRLSTWDLYQLTLCPKRLIESGAVERESSPARDLIKKIFILKALGREKDWSLKGLAPLWDEIFWKDREYTQEAADESVQGLLAARKLYQSLPDINEGKFNIHPVSNLKTMVDSSVELSSLGDFLLEYQNRYETWIYLHSEPRLARRTVLPQLEHYLVGAKIREQRPFYLVFYFLSTERLTPIHFRIQDTTSQEECGLLAAFLTTQCKKRISYPVRGVNCKDCPLGC